MKFTATALPVIILATIKAVEINVSISYVHTKYRTVLRVNRASWRASGETPLNCARPLFSIIY